MRIFYVSLILIQLLVACSPASTVNLPASVEKVLEEAPLSLRETWTSISTIAPTSLPIATPLPTVTPTPIPLVYDREGYRQFAVLRNNYPGFNDYRADKNYSGISTSLSPDGSMIAISACWGSMTNTLECETSQSGFLIVLDTGTGELISYIPLGEGWPGRTAFTADGTSLIYSTHERKVALWDLSTKSQGLILYDRKGSRSVRLPDVAVSPDGQSYAAVVDASLFVWDTAGNEVFQAPALSTKWNAALSYSADGSRLIALAPDRIGVDVYNTSDWTLVRRISQVDVEDAAITPDGQILASVNSTQNTVEVWDLASGDQIETLDPEHRVLKMAFNPKGDLLILVGFNNLDQPDDYYTIGSLYETNTWTKFDSLYSLSGDGEVRFSKDGSRLGVFGYGLDSILGKPDAQLLSGLEVVKQFQTALHDGDFATAASLFKVDERDTEYLKEIGLDPADLPGSLKNLCSNQTIFCHPVQELVLMGYDWEDMGYMVRLQGPDGATFTSPKGAQIIFLYLTLGADGKPLVYYLPQDL
jgi:WD40 repeat protein